MRFNYEDINVSIGRTENARGEGCLWTDHIKNTLAAAIRERKPTIIKFDGQQVEARNNPRMDSKRSMRFLLDDYLLVIAHWKKDGITKRYYR
jgi:hypothetical protein